MNMVHRSASSSERKRPLSFPVPFEKPDPSLREILLLSLEFKEAACTCKLKRPRHPYSSAFVDRSR